MRRRVFVQALVLTLVAATPLMAQPRAERHWNRADRREDVRDRREDRRDRRH